MKKQIVIIHGGSCFKTYKNYLLFLKNSEFEISYLKKYGGWKNKLQDKIGGRYEVLLPDMPNPSNARYKEWSIFFDKIAKLLSEDVILIGHSLGGIFLAKYINEKIFLKKIKMVILIAPPYDETCCSKKIGESLMDFKLPSSLKKFALQVNNIYLIHSKDDPVVPFSHLAKYKKLLPKAKTIIFKDRKHFNQATFPEIIKIINL